MAQRFGRFWLHEKIGHGGMAEIFRASIGPDPDEYAFEVVVKRLHPKLQEDAQQVDAFMTEADIAKFLSHPNLLQVYESGLVDERPFIAMEYIWGMDLARLLGMMRHRRSKFPSDLAVFTALNVLRGLDYVHRARAPGGATMDLIHRDITPENIFVTFRGEVKFGDFGIAKVSFLGNGGYKPMVEGKLRYLPPEVLGGGEPSQRDDLWGLAATLYEMLTGRGLYADIPDDELIGGVFDTRIEAIQLVNPDVGPRLARIVNRALSSKPSKRYQSAAELYRELKLYLRGEGIRVESSALARFVRSATGLGTNVTEPVTNPGEANFITAGYHSPIGPSITQRFDIIRRKRFAWWPVVVVGGAIAVGFTVLYFAGAFG